MNYWYVIFEVIFKRFEDMFNSIKDIFISFEDFFIYLKISLIHFKISSNNWRYLQIIEDIFKYMTISSNNWGYLQIYEDIFKQYSDFTIWSNDLKISLVIWIYVKTAFHTMDLSYRTSCWMNFNKYTFDLNSVHAVMSPGWSKTF